MALALLAAAAISLPSSVSANNGDKGNSGTMVSIHNDGAVLVRGATVTSLSGDVIVARTSWGDTDISWEIDTDGATEFYSKGGADSSFDNVDEGDMVSFSGSLDRDDGAFSVDAKVVRNWSIDDVRATVTGTIESIDEDADSFVLETKSKGEVTVTTDGDTDIFLRNKSDADFGDLAVGAFVSVTGAYDDGNDTLDASSISLGLRIFPSKEIWSSWKDWGAKVSAKFFGHDK